jgi:hypothetical protein
MKKSIQIISLFLVLIQLLSCSNNGKNQIEIYYDKVAESLIDFINDQAYASIKEGNVGLSKSLFNIHNPSVIMDFKTYNLEFLNHHDRSIDILPTSSIKIMQKYFSKIELTDIDDAEDIKAIRSKKDDLDLGQGIFHFSAPVFTRSGEIIIQVFLHTSTSWIYLIKEDDSGVLKIDLIEYLEK